jgi:hypothetical protein
VRQEGHSTWRSRAGRIGLLATLAASGAMFASALGGIASIDVNAESAQRLAQPPAQDTRGIDYNHRDCPEHQRPPTQES